MKNTKNISENFYANGMPRFDFTDKIPMPKVSPAKQDVSIENIVKLFVKELQKNIVGEDKNK